MKTCPTNTFERGLIKDKPWRTRVFVCLFAGVFFSSGCSGISASVPKPVLADGQSTPPPALGVGLLVGLQPTLSPTPWPTLTITPSPTLAAAFNLSPAATCDPGLVEFCLYPYTGVLQPPHKLPDRVTPGPGYGYGSSDHGKRPAHHGVDFNNPTGTPVYAAADGRVVVAGDDRETSFGAGLNFYGGLVILEHFINGTTLYTLYGHLSMIGVEAGQVILAGDQIGEVGATGSAAGGHLHFEVRQGLNLYQNTRNPELWLRPYDVNGQQGGYLAARIADTEGRLLHAYFNIQYFETNTEDASAEWQVYYESYSFDQFSFGQEDWLRENFALGGLRPGYYLITIKDVTVTYERLVEVKPGQLSFAVIEIE
ncbi:MAG: M23 family metallopeptidase [Anaerolineales bacterium]|nr:M23 family metallopeptidase [Anaerolineales bacterium]